MRSSIAYFFYPRDIAHLFWRKDASGAIDQELKAFGTALEPGILQAKAFLQNQLKSCAAEHCRAVIERKDITKRCVLQIAARILKFRRRVSQGQRGKYS